MRLLLGLGFAYGALMMALRQLPNHQFPEIASCRLETVALLSPEALDLLRAAGIHFNSEPDRFGIGGRPWAAVESRDGTPYVLVQHGALGGKVEVRVREDASAPRDLVARLCDAAAIGQELVIAVASQWNGDAAAVDGVSRGNPFSGLFSRIRDPSSWGYRRVLTGGLRTRISPRAMNRIATGYAHYAPLRVPVARSSRRGWRGFLGRT